MKISQKIIIGFLGSSLILVGYIFLTMKFSSKVKSQTKKVIEATSAEITTANNISQSLDSINKYTEKVLFIDYHPKEKPHIKEYQERIEKQVNSIIIDVTKVKQATINETKITLSHNNQEKTASKVSELAQDQAEDLVVMTQLTTELSEYQKNLQLFLKNAEANKIEEARKIYNNELRLQKEKINEILLEYKQRSVDEINESQETINSQTERFLNTIQLYIFFTVGISLASYTYIYRSIYSPIKQLKIIARNKLVNDLKINLDDSRLKDDDFNFLVDSYERFHKYLNKQKLSLTYFKKVLGAIRYGLIILSPELTIKKVNQATLQIFGYSQDELKGQHINFILKDISSPQIKQSIKKNTANQSQIIGLSKEQKEIHLAWSSTLLFNEQEHVDSIVCVVRDITKEYLAEKNLRESEQRYSLAATANNQGLWEWNRNNNLAYYSLAWKSMLGYQESEIGQTLDDWFNLVHPDHLELLKAKFIDYLNNSNSQFNITYQAQHKNGNYRWLFCCATSVKDSFGQIYRLVGSQTDITETKQREEKLHYESLQDPLTNLPNRTAFNQKLQKLSQNSIKLARENNNCRLAVMLIDLNSFRAINDSLGYAAGDKILKEFAKRITNSLPVKDNLVACLGGDRFALILENIKNEREAKAIAESILQEIENPFKVDIRQIFVSASIGIALSTTNYENLEELLRDSETAMYCAKKSTQTSYAIFSPSMHLTELERLDTENSLYQAINQSKLKVCYQPIIDLFTKQISGFEAVMSWENKEKALISLDSKIATIKNQKLLTRINWSLIENSCIQISQWQETSGKDSPLFLYINVLDNIFFQQNFSARISRIIKENNLQPYNLQLAITSTTIQKNSKQTKSILKDLKSLGVKIALDDSGKGYLSLNDLYSLPIDTLKINNLSVEKIGSERGRLEFMRALITLTTSLKIKTIASRVETLEQSKKLLELNYQYGQGTFFSGIQTSDVAEALILNQKTSCQSLE